MVRAPCCEKMGLKKGPWTPEEDEILINYIQLHGHGNWRALPKQAGLLRCGKSCRLRWTNYLRPDIKRGNFTSEEEDTIINLHEMLGNRWSAIAARLPGRTDNEIKNVWHTQLKKRVVMKNHGSNSNHDKKRQAIDPSKATIRKEQEPVNFLSRVVTRSTPVSPPESSSEDSTTRTSENINNNNNNNNIVTCMKIETVHKDSYSHEIDDNFWSQVWSADNSTNKASDFQVFGSNPPVPQPHHYYFPSSPLPTLMEPVNDDDHGSNHLYDSDINMDFWYNLLSRAGDLPDINYVPEI